MSNKKRNTQIPLEAIEGAAGINDKFELKSVGTCQYLHDINKKPTKDNAETKVSGSAERIMNDTNNSMELTEGMVIKAENTPIRTRQSEIGIDK